MIIMLDTSHDLSVATEEIGYPCHQLLTPLTKFANRHPRQRFAIDNGAFSKSGFKAGAFLSLLERETANRHLCRFVAVPDVVGSARRTLEVFDHWSDQLNQWPLAFVCQDGQEDLPIPFKFIAAVFIGGSTKWKESEAAHQCMKAAQLLDKWVHVGRVNEPARFEACLQMQANSIDGTGIGMYSYMREKIRDRNGDHRLFRTSEMVNV